MPQPGRHYLITPEDLSRPGKSHRLYPRYVSKMPDLRAPVGFQVKLFASGLKAPRSILAAPNGDILVTESYKGRIVLLRDANGDGMAETRSLFASGHKMPYGLALAPGWLYVGNTNSVVRYRYRPGQLKSSGRPAVVIPSLPSRGWRQHWTRNLVFSPDGERLYVSVGSETNKSPEDPPRATIQECDPETGECETFATGMRNPVGMAFQPGTRQLWATCVERDYMGDNLVPDFVTRVDRGDFFGWPWYYIGNHPDPDLAHRNAPKKDARVPDVLIRAHSTPLGLAFYTGRLFPRKYHGDLFVALRGSTNRSEMSGYRIVRIDFENGKHKPGYEDFIVGWNPEPSTETVHGRPVGLAVDRHGALLITDEPGGKVWRVTYN